MIFARLVVTIYLHEKVLKAGPAAFGMWSACLAYLREHESSDGHLKHHVVGSFFGLGRAEATKLCEKLVTVGLFGKHPEDGYILLRYSDFNETREQIDARRKADKERKAFRKDSRRNSDRNPPGSLSDSVSRPHGDGGGFPGSGSGSGSVISEGEREREPNAVTVVTQGARRPWPESLTLTPELQAYAEQLGLSDVPAVWAKFRSMAIERQWVFDDAGWGERWKRFAADERKYQRIERERESGTVRRGAPVSRDDENPNPVTRRRVSESELDEHIRRKLGAQQADDAQADRARVASTRPPAQPTKLGGGRT